MPNASPPPRLSLAVAAAFYGATLAVAIGWAWLTEPGVALLSARPVALPLPWWAAGLATGLLLVGISAAAEARLPAMRALADELASLVGRSDFPRALVLALLSGVAEEALFRGPVQHALGYVIASVGFALLHGGVSARYLPWSTFALLAGLSFGLLAEAYHSVAPAALAHVVVNAINLHRLGRDRRAVG
ncbi:MAG: CPBP family intramembrane metalloprotease [Myxococcales bacterium]|nr:CPBP family intramembrane metalloprotease [Myxococcales bacterium]